MSLTNLQKKTSQAIINCFETGKILGDYGQVTLLKGDTGHLTYGRSQTTLASGNLYGLLEDYVGMNGEYSADLHPYLERVSKKDLSLDYEEDFKSILKLAGSDPIMVRAQDIFFDRIYWEPAMKESSRVGIDTPLGCSVIYDSFIHGSWYRIKDSVDLSFGKCKVVGEKLWVTEYLSKRRYWLENHTNPLLRKTAYRIIELQKLARDNWDLKLPLSVRGNIITEENIIMNPSETTFFVSSAQGNTDIPLRYSDPKMRGSDVVLIQKMLNKANPSDEKICVDGIFGKDTVRAVIVFQCLHGLKSDGIVGKVTRSHLLDYENE
jgi:chitosanase